MERNQLVPQQQAVIEAPLDHRIFISGPAGTGKTTAGVRRLRALLENGVPGDSVLILTPQRTLQEPYLDWLNNPDRAAGGDAVLATLGGLARRMCGLFWPLAALPAGFAHPENPPVFLSLETAQYYLAHIVRPLLEAGYFESVTIDRNRLYSQILDNLNKAAVVGFPYAEIGGRLDSAFFGDPAQRRIYADAQDCVNRFRQYCLEHNLLDFSLQVEVFTDILWPDPQVRAYLTRTFRHLIYDNVEEDFPRAHDIIRDWLPEFQSALLIFDEGAGFRQFLGSDPSSGQSLRDLCDKDFLFDQSLVMSEPVAGLRRLLVEAVRPAHQDLASQTAEPGWRDAAQILASRFYPELLETIASEVQSLISAHEVPASEIVILAPYLSDALRFSLSNRLEARGVPWRSHRPSRSLHDEPASHALITLAELAHPDWGIRPHKLDVAYALMQALEGLDLVRAQLLSEIVYRDKGLELSSFDLIKADAQERITFTLGNRYSLLRDWLLAYRAAEPLAPDHFLRKLFGEVLSQPGFGFHSSLDAIRVAASLVESVRNFRQAMEPALSDLSTLGREYIALLNDGVIAAQYLEGWRTQEREAVLIAPAYTFLMMNRPVSIQFWMDVGSGGWYERPSQPLTHPYVLSRTWEPDRLWSDADEIATRQEAMRRLVAGLLARCRQSVYIGLSELGESGFEERGDLLRAFQRILQDNSGPPE